MSSSVAAKQASDPRLALHEAVERLEEAHVVGDRAVEHDVDRVDELRLRGTRRLRQRVELHALAVRDGFGDVGFAAALEVGAQEGEAAVGARRQGNVAIRDLLFVAGRQDGLFAALALVHAGGADVFDRRLPPVIDASRDRVLLIRWGDLQHHRADVLGVVGREELDRVGIGRKCLVLPRHRPRPIDDLVEVAAALFAASNMRCALTAGTLQTTASMARRFRARSAS